MKMKMIATGAVALALLAAMGIFAVADTATYSGNPSASGTVTARAEIRPRIELTITTPNTGQAVEFGVLDPGETDSAPVTLRVRSNQPFNLDKTITGQDTLMGLTTDLGNLTNQPRGVNNFTDNYTINVPWDTPPGNYSASVLYTVTQQ